MIEIKNLKFGYKKNKILFDNLNLNLNKGCIHGLLGKNGAGKTTLLKQIAGLTFPDEGSCNVMNFNPSSRLPEFLQEIFFVPEEFSLPSVSIKKFVKIHAPFYPKFDEKFFNNCLEQFEMSPNENLNSISFGQKKKFFLSFALAVNTKLLILDEPTNALDIPSKSTFRKIIASVLNEDKTIIISTHQVRDLESLIDSVVILNEGKIILNQNISNISEKLCFGKINNDALENDILYSEEVFGSKFGVLVNKNNEDSRVNLELLFNGVVRNSSVYSNLFKN